jgi:hypothetical protein
MKETYSYTFLEVLLECKQACILSTSLNCPVIKVQHCAYYCENWLKAALSVGGFTFFLKHEGSKETEN